MIKAAQAGAVARRLGKVDFADHLREAAEIMERARAEAVKIVVEAEGRGRVLAEEAERRGAAEGYEKGFADGFTAGKETALAEGRKEFQERLGSLAQAFQAGLAAIEESKVHLELEAQKNVLDFAVSAASQLTFAIGELRREAACENLRRALTLVIDKTNVTVRCHPKDMQTLKVLAEEMLGTAQSGRRVQMVEDDAVPPGGCVLRNGTSQVDASLETQVAEMVSILLGSGKSA